MAAVPVVDRVMGFLAELRTRRLLVPVVAVAAGALTAAVALAIQLPGSSQGASGAPKATGAATVQRQNLVATDTQSGTLGYAKPSTVYNRLSGTITWLPTVGQQITAGGTLFKVDNSPVVLFEGATPAYRTLTSGVSDGPDIQELNQNLVNLGFDPSHEITVNQTWQTGTTDAVNRWQSATGQTQTGSVTLGQVVFLPGAQLITTVQTLLGSTGGSAASGASGSGSGSSGSGSSSSGTGASGSAASSTSQARLSGTPPAPQFVDLKTTTTTTTPDSSTATMTPSGSGSGSGSGNGGSSGNGSAQSNAQLLALIALLKAEIAELKASKSSAAAGSSSRGGSAGASTSAAAGRSAGGGGGGGSSAGGGAASGGSGASGAGSSAGAATAQPVLQTTSNQEVVTVNLDATKQTEAVVGEDVTVQLPNSSTVDGKITQVSPVAQSSSSSSGASGAGGSGASAQPSATIPVTITLTGKRPVRGLDQAAVSVNFAQQRASNVLSVPVTALIATQGGGYVVQQAASPHTLIPVTPGLFAAGYVQISGSGIYPGLQVTDSQG